MRRATRPSVVSDGDVVWICGGGKVSELDPRASSVRRSLEAVRSSGDRLIVTSDEGVEVWHRPEKSAPNKPVAKKRAAKKRAAKK